MIHVQQAFIALPGTTHTLKSISEHSDLDPSVVYRILQSAIEKGAIERVSRGRYRLGSSVAGAGLHAMAGLYGSLDQHHVLVELQRKAGGMALLYALASPGARRVCIDHALGDYSFSDFGISPSDVFTVGYSLRVGASGRTLLAFAPESLQQLVLSEEVPSEAGPGALHNAELISSLADIRTRGYAIGYEECVAGWDSVAVPVLWGNVVFGVVLLLMPSADLQANLTEHIEHVRHAAQLISNASTDSTHTTAA
ncbi:IclR family transcriptional regulator C-terminal domain-containing protein [Streptomyces sp. G1]|uniref:IclR family transcriptional regulator domain-containing protein n=1 Tax=Streptomyces sp. G1 TaxID=361572 RepID=UPI00202EB991|nr:IclR family transcriptional regulator C-terminal domain-containing protein [Streptomyces sp. G1]MCM1965093.1 IclR family transcriptional regulator [Streptomyces sp. G1]